MTIIRKIKLGFYVAVLAAALAYWYSVYFPSAHRSGQVEVSTLRVPAHTDTSKIPEALEFVKTYGYSRTFAILMNLAPHSGNYRFFGVNLLTKDTLIRGLVAHGHCQSTENRYAEFSNESGSNCSSLGHYKIGTKYQGSFGTSYKLHGMDYTNCNAYDRFVVLHSHSCIPVDPQEDDICQSQGCPAIAPTVLDEVMPYLDNTHRPILLWIYK